MMKASLAALAAALMMAAASTPATAQSDDYRDGYREGYRAGFHDARNGRDFDDSVRERRDRYSESDDMDRGRHDRNDRWRERYSRDYSYRDDGFYQECRNQPDPGGVIAGALIGGLLGNAVGRGGGRAGATVAGVIVGGAAGAALTSHLECDDRSYVYRSYYDGFNGGRSERAYPWRNPRNGHRGEVRVERYFTDQDGFRCVRFTQSNNIDGRRYKSRGVACQQPDGSWAVVS